MVDLFCHISRLNAILCRKSERVVTEHFCLFSCVVTVLSSLVEFRWKVNVVPTRTGKLLVRFNPRGMPQPNLTYTFRTNELECDS